MMVGYTKYTAPYSPLTEGLLKEGKRVRDIGEKQAMLSKELVGLKDEMKRALKLLPT